MTDETRFGHAKYNPTGEAVLIEYIGRAGAAMNYRMYDLEKHKLGGTATEYMLTFGGCGDHQHPAAECEFLRDVQAKWDGKKAPITQRAGGAVEVARPEALPKGDDMTHTFTYPDYGTPVGFPELVAHSGQTCEIVRELGDDERDREVGRMFIVRFADGVEATASASELTPRPEDEVLTLNVAGGAWDYFAEILEVWTQKQLVVRLADGRVVKLLHFTGDPYAEAKLITAIFDDTKDDDCGETVELGVNDLSGCVLL